MQALRSIFRLLKICTSTREGKWEILYFVMIFLLSLLGVYIAVKMITWSKDFFNALENRDLSAAALQVGIFAILVSGSSGQYLIKRYLGQVLQIKWRKVLTEKTLTVWLDRKTYWHLDVSESSKLDNPDQRIAEDCRIFLEKMTEEAIDLITKIIGLFSFFMILWSITDFTLSFTLFGYDVEIPRYMVWAAPIYVAICSGMAHWLGKPLLPLTVGQQRKEADFRFALTRFRESKEAIALQNGEEVERDILDARFSEIVKNWKALIKREFILGCFTRPYMATILRIPIFLALPIYLVGQASLGTLMQIASAFSNVATSLSWFIFSYNDLAKLAASSVRLEQFLTQAENFHVNRQIGSAYQDDDQHLSIQNLNLYTGNGTALIDLPYVRVEKGDKTILRGHSGIGKSTLIRSLAGLHSHYLGKIIAPAGKKMFLSQKAYFPLGGFAHSVTYPQKLLVEENLLEIKTILKKVGFSEKDIDEKLLSCDLAQLSGGEQQRLIFARIIYNKPEWIFIDEGTNALDEASEKMLLALLQTELPDASYVIVTHSDTLCQHIHNAYQLELKGDLGF